MSAKLDLDVHAYRPASDIEECFIWGLGIVVVCGYLTAVARSGAGLVKRCFKFLLKREVKEKEELKAIVENHMIDLKVSHLRLYFALVCCICFPWTLALLVGLAHGSFPRISTPAAETAWLLFQAFSTVIFIKPTLLTPRNLDGAFLLVVAHGVFQETPLLCCTRDGVDRANLVSLVYMLTLNLVRGIGNRRELIILAAGNIVFISCVAYTRWVTFRRVEALGSLIERTALLALLTLLSMVLSAVLEAGYRRLIIQGLQLAEAREMHKAATALLHSCYDVVVELDSSGLVDGASQDLGSLLLRTGRSMHGVKLADLIVDEEDRRKFQDRLSAPSTETVGVADTMHVTMKDVLGNTLRMEMMWFACKRAEGVTHFIVGIREFSDQMQVPLGGSSRSAGGPDFFPAVAPSPDEDSSSSEDLSEAESVDIEADQAVIVVDLTDHRCPIRGVTSGFRAHVGYVSRNAPLVTIFRRTELMVNWMQNVVNSVMNDRPPPADHSVALQVPQGKLRARCRLVLMEDAGKPDVDLENVVVLLYDITCSRSRHSGGKRGLSGTPARPAPDPSCIATL